MSISQFMDLTERQIFALAEASSKAEEDKIKFAAAIHGVKLKDKVGATTFTPEERQSLSAAMHELLNKPVKKGV